MHDPDYVLFEIRRPVPKIRHRKRPLGKTPSFGVFTRLGHWEAYFPAVFVIWHHEPKGADSGTVCKGGPGTGLSLRALRWGWTHRRHLWVQNVPWQAINRRLWTRCAECGQPFRRKQSVNSHSWNGGGPGWKKAETNVYHDRCSSLVHVRGQLDDATKVLQGTADSNARWRVDYRLRNLEAAHNVQAQAPEKAQQSDGNVCDD